MGAEILEVILKSDKIMFYDAVFCKSHLDQVKVLRSTFITEGAVNTVMDCYP